MASSPISSEFKDNWLCKTCGNEFPASNHPPSACPICQDERQWVPKEGQQWVSATQIAANHKNEIREIEPGLFGIGVTPAFAIGQISFFIPGEKGEGGILWEGTPLLDDAAINWLKSMGGVKAMVMSHPHLYSAMVTNAKKLGNVPIYLPRIDQNWLQNPADNVQFFDQNMLQLSPKLVVYVTGGHFEGSSFLHWTGDKANQGVILSGDTIYVASDRKHVSFLYSTPNRVPLGLKAVRRIVEKTEDLKFERLYSSWWDSAIESDAKSAILQSEKRWQRLINAA